jgi:hypothetical protein
MFQSMRQWPLVGPSVSSERPQGLLLWQKQLMMLFLQLFLVLPTFFIYLLFLFFFPSLIKPLFSDLARSSSPLAIHKLDIANNIKMKAVYEFKRNVLQSG